jgi:hypothetical protein
LLTKSVANKTGRSSRPACFIFWIYSISSYYLAQAFQPAGSGDFPAASFVRMKHGTRMSRKPADKNVCATSKLEPPWVLTAKSYNQVAKSRRGGTATERKPGFAKAVPRQTPSTQRRGGRREPQSFSLTTDEHGEKPHGGHAAIRGFKATIAVLRSADFQTGYVADFQVGRTSGGGTGRAFGNPRYSRLGSLAASVSSCEMASEFGISLSPPSLFFRCGFPDVSFSLRLRVFEALANYWLCDH